MKEKNIVSADEFIENMNVKVIMSAGDLEFAVKREPHKYIVMLLSPRIEKGKLDHFSKTFHIVKALYRGREYDGMIPNVYKRDRTEFYKAKGIDENFTRDNLNPPSTGIFEKIIDVDDGSYLQLFNPKTTAHTRKYIKSLFMTRNMRHEGRMRSGVICAHPKGLPEIKITGDTGIQIINKAYDENE